MIANARMYSVSPVAGAAWQRLFAAILRRAGLQVDYLEHAPPLPIAELWQRRDAAAVFMCGLPYSRADVRLHLVAAPLPSPATYRRLPQYWSEFVVRAESPFHHIEDTFGGNIAFTEPGSQSGFGAALHYLMTAARSFPLYAEVIAPQVNPLGVVEAVLAGRADVAPVDSYALSLLQVYRADLTSRLRVVARSARTSIPAIVASQAPAPGLQKAFAEAADDAHCRSLLSDLLLEGFVQPQPGAYDALALNFATSCRFWRLHALASVVHPAFVV
jgi:ABC-type phosphate/phosphonate transport system substrate-binding protein